MNGSLMNSVSIVAAVVVAAMCLFQILLAMGLPLGHAAFGGSDRVLPKKLRYASAMTVFVFLAALFVILAGGGFLGEANKSSSLARIGIWVLVVVFGVSTLANISSMSRWERYLMAPVGLVLTLCCVTLGLS